ncbi:tripartite tricarboxylate transporter substrate binding protein [Alcaligenaceae bacterium]|nr:tripartite tricarboxylate transporter substrate binding protein [Alcaligenaceae bacterium]
MHTTLRPLRFLLYSAVLVLPVSGAYANTYPERPIRMIVPYGAGGPTDMLARALSQRLSERLKQPIIVENKPGAGSIIGVEYVAKAQPDGYTLLFTAGGALVINPAMNSTLPYKASDFAPVSSAATYTMFLAVNPKLGFKSIKDLIDYGKANPGSLSYGSAGNGTSNHLAGELLQDKAGIKLIHVPYKGNAPAMSDVIGGNISMMFDLPSTSLSFGKTGQVKLLGTTGQKPDPLAPEVPAISKEVPGYDVTSWFGVFAPAKTAPAIVNKLSESIVEILKDPTVSAALVGQGYQVSGSTPAKLAEMIETDSKLWGDLIKQANLQIK